MCFYYQTVKSFLTLKQNSNITLTFNAVYTFRLGFRLNIGFLYSVKASQILTLALRVYVCVSARVL